MKENSLRICLINTPSLFKRPLSRSMAGGLGFDGNQSMILPPLDLAVLASRLRTEGHRVSILDADALRADDAAVYQMVRQGKYEVVMAVVSLPALENDCAFICGLHDMAKEIIVKTMVRDKSVLQEILEKSRADFIIHAECDLHIHEIIEGRSVAGTAFLKDGVLVYEDAAPVGDLDSLPFPAWDLLPYDKYTYPLLGNLVMTMQTSRGCPFPCSYYCPYPLVEGNVWRSQSPERVYQEMDRLVKEFGIKKVLFRDATFTFNMERIHKICDLIIANSLRVEWWCETRVDRLNDGLLEKMRNAGCAGINIGVETGDQKVMESQAKRGLTVEKLIHLRLKAKSLGIKLHFLLSKGFPAETKKSFVDTFELMMKLRPESLGITIMTPYPGTRLYKEAEEKGWIESRNWEDYGGHQFVMHTDNLSREDFYYGLKFLNMGNVLIQKGHAGADLYNLRKIEKDIYTELLVWAADLNELRERLGCLKTSAEEDRTVSQTQNIDERFKMSVIIPTYNRKEQLLECLDHLSRQTADASMFEVIIVDDGSTDGTAEKIRGADTPFSLRYYHQKNAGPGRARNLGVDLASNDIVAFIGDDIMVSPDFIKEHLNTHNMNPDCKVAVLGLIEWPPEFEITPFMEYITGPGGQQFAFPTIKDSNDAGPAFFYTSNISLKKTLLKEQPYLFDHDFIFAAYEDIELGIRLHEQGLRIVYNESALAFHKHHMTLESFCERQYKAGRMGYVFDIKKAERKIGTVNVNEDLLVRAASPDALNSYKAAVQGLDGIDVKALDRIEISGKSMWQIIKEAVLFPLYKSILDNVHSAGYLEEYTAKKNMPAESACAEEVRMRLLVITNDPPESACPFIRIKTPLRWLEKTGRLADTRVLYINEEADFDVGEIKDLDAVILQRVNNRVIAEQIIAVAGKSGVPVIYDLDDLLTEVPMYNQFYDLASNSRDAVVNIIKKADAVTVSTEFLRQKLQQLNPSVYVLPNYIDPEMWGDEKIQYRTGGIITFGVFGTPTHDDDLRLLVPAVRRILRDYPGRVRFKLLGCVISELEGDKDIITEKRFYLDYRNYVKFLKSRPVDAVLVPLTRNEFNLCKSNIKYLEYSACGLPGIYSDLGPYSSDITHGVNGLLAGNSAESWYDCMKRLIEEEDTRNVMAENARRDVLKRYDINQKAALWYETYSTIKKGKNTARGGVSIVIPVFNNIKYTMQCLEAVAANTAYEPYEVVIVDNGSTDGTKEYLASLSGDVRILSNDTNLGFAPACNQGARAAQGDYIVFLNNDTVPQPGWLENMVKVVREMPEAAIVGSKLLYPDDTIQHAGVVFDVRDSRLLLSHIYRCFDKDHPAVNHMREFNAVTAACMLVRKEVFFDLGMLDEGYKNGYEDVDFCLKAREKGHKIIYNPGSVLYHHESVSEGRFDFGERNTNHFIKQWGNKIQSDYHEKLREDGLTVQYLGENKLRYVKIDDAKEDAQRKIQTDQDNGKSGAEGRETVKDRSGHDEEGEKVLKKIAIVRGASLNKWEMQNYEPLSGCYDITAYTTTQTYFDISRIGLPVVQLPFESQGLLMEMKGLEAHLADKDLVFSADITYKFSEQAVQAKKISGCKVVCLEWENIPFNFEEHDAAKRIKETVRYGADHFIAVTKRAKEALVLEGVEEERIDVIPMGIDLSRFRPDKSLAHDYRVKLGIHNREIIVLYIGRMVWEKGIYDFVHAAARIIRHRESLAFQVRFIMAGSGKELDQLKERAACIGLSDSLTIIENIPYEDMHKIHNLADIFVLPSIPVKNWQEQFGMVLIESMACGKPVISTYSGSIPEVVGDAGILVQPNDHLSLSEAMRRLISDRTLREELGSKSLDRAQTYFDAGKNAEKFRAVFDKVLSRRTPKDSLRDSFNKAMETWETGEREKGFTKVCANFKKDPDRKDVLDALVRMGKELNRFDEVEQSLKEYLAYHPADLDVLASLAETYVQLGKPEKAEEELRKVIIFDPENKRAAAILNSMKHAVRNA
ncbi:MAG: glycosyltransferase [Nitrospirota bacterium]